MKSIAALIFFTRLPLYKWIEIPAEYYKNLVAWWAMTGWLTASLTAGVLWLCSLILPWSVSILIALISRLFLTGALHEDGLADFFDGFGGGRNKEKILSIMKDSHIGTYGVISLIIYFALWFALIHSLNLRQAIIIILVADPCAKGISSFIINKLPYARKEEESKAKVVYTPMSPIETGISLLFGLSPMLLLTTPFCWLAIIPPLLFLKFFTDYIGKRIGGYTGDCCGALYLLNEIILIISLICFFQWNLF